MPEIFFGIIFIAIGLYEYFFAGETYFRWWFKKISRSSADYDLRKFKAIHLSFHVIEGLLVASLALVDLSKDSWFVTYMCLAICLVVAHYFLALRCCKK